MVHCLADPEGIHNKEETTVVMATSGLEYMTTHFLIRGKSWAQDERNLCMMRGHGRTISGGGSRRALESRSQGRRREGQRRHQRRRQRIRGRDAEMGAKAEHWHI